MRSPDRAPDLPSSLDESASSFNLEFFIPRSGPGISLESDEPSGIKEAILRWLDEQL